MPAIVRIGLWVCAVACVLQGLAHFVGAVPAAFRCAKGCWLPNFLSALLGERGANFSMTMVLFALASMFVWFAISERSKKP